MDKRCKRNLFLEIIVFFCVMCLVLVKEANWDDVMCTFGIKHYETIQIENFEQCEFYDCELGKSGEIIITGADPQIHFSQIAGKAMVIKDIWTQFDANNSGYGALKWYWTVRGGYTEQKAYVQELTPGVVEQLVGMGVDAAYLRLDIEYVSAEEPQILVPSIIINTEEFSHLKAKTLEFLKWNGLSLLLVVTVFFGLRVLLHDAFSRFVLLKEIAAVSVYYIFVPVLGANLSGAMKWVVLLLVALLIGWIACLGGERREVREQES